MPGLDFIGDVHGCFKELTTLFQKAGYEKKQNIYEHPKGRLPVFIGDLTDRGPASVETIKLVSQLVSNRKAKYVPGNHCNKLYRYLLGRNVIINHGLETTVEEFNSLSSAEYKNVKADFMKLYEEAPLYERLENDQVIAVHAGIMEYFIGRSDKTVHRFALYGDITGEKNPDGTPIRRDWTKKYKGKQLVVYGHTPVKETRQYGRTVNIDTGCVFGGKLTMLHYPAMTFTQAASSLPMVPEKFRAFDKVE